ncbi:MAG: hypothetical protein AB3N20_08220 [Rhizobiaceae bacterium]
MKAITITIALFVPAVALANPSVKHDQRLEQAAVDIVASKIGEIRGGFLNGEKADLVAGNARVRHSLFLREQPREYLSGDWHNGLAPARAMPRHRIGNL